MANDKHDITEIVSLVLQRDSSTLTVVDCNSAIGRVTVKDDMGKRFHVVVTKAR